jgi:Putative prokaryotic signal transducing protein
MSRPPGAHDELVCPGCGSRFGPQERFCDKCAMPLVRAGSGQEDPDVSERHRRARMVKPQLGEGELVRVAGAGNLAEAEFIQALLLEEGVPSMLRRSAGFDVPDFLAAGPRDILVPQSGLETAREILLEAEIIAPQRAAATVAPGRLLAGLALALIVGALVIWAAGQLIHA